MFLDFAQDDQTFIHVVVLLFVFFFLPRWAFLESTHLTSQETWTRLLPVSFIIVSVRAARSLALS